MDKQTVRFQMKTLRSNLLQNEVFEKSRKITRNLSTLPQLAITNHILIYLPVNNEVDTKNLIEKLFSENKTVYLPYYDSQSAKYAITKFHTGNGLAEGPYGIKQPQNCTPASISEIDLAFLPGLAFDENRFRLGYGKGVYDKLLENSKSTKIGLAYDFQLLEQIPHENHDLNMDFVVTEKQIIKMRP